MHVHSIASERGDIKSYFLYYYGTALKAKIYAMLWFILVLLSYSFRVEMKTGVFPPGFRRDDPTLCTGFYLRFFLLHFGFTVFRKVHSHMYIFFFSPFSNFSLPSFYPSRFVYPFFVLCSLPFPPFSFLFLTLIQAYLYFTDFHTQTRKKYTQVSF